MKPLPYIDRVTQSREFQEKAAKAEAHWEKIFRQSNPSFSEALALEQIIKRLHEGNMP